MKRLIPFIIALVIISAYAIRAESALSINEIDACSKYPLVTVKIAIDVNDGSISEISKANFTLFEDGKAIAPTDLVPLSAPETFHTLIIAIDTSKSISHRSFEKIKQSVRDIVASLTENEKAAIVRFNDHVVQMNSLHATREQITAKISTLKRHGSKTLLYSALYDSLLKLRDMHGKQKSLYVFTDGKDEGSPVQLEEVLRLSKESGIPIHVICPAEQSCSSEIKRVAQETHGNFAASIESFNVSSVKKTSIPGKAEYLISYESKTPLDGKKHQLEIRFSKGALSDRAFSDFTTSASVQPLNVPHLLDILIAALILILIILLAMLIAIIIRNGYRLLAPPAADTQKKSSIPDFFDPLDDEPVSRYAPTLTPRDPEFAYSKAWLVMKDGPASGQKFPIFWDETAIGREATNTIVVPDQAVSLTHAKIKRFKDTYMLFDLVSENGTYLNGKKLLRPKTLCDWDEIKIGRTVFIFRGSKIKE